MGWTLLAALQKTHLVSFLACKNGHLFSDLGLLGTVTMEMSEAVPPRWNVREGGCSALRPGGKVAMVGKRHVGTIMKSGVVVSP